MFDFIITGVVRKVWIETGIISKQRFEPKKVSGALILPFTAVYQYGKIGILKIAMTDLHKQSFQIVEHNVNCMILKESFKIVPTYVILKAFYSMYHGEILQ